MSELEKYGWVNALRGYAVLLVIMVHSAQHFPVSSLVQLLTHTGDMGVQLFFVMSSFTLFNSYSKRMKEDKTFVDRNFFLRRFFRIAPYYYLAALMYVAYTVWVEKSPVNVAHLLVNMTFTNTLYLPAITYLPPGGWSVGIEMFFYLTIPFLFRFVTSLKKAAWFLVLAVCLSYLIHYLAYIYVAHHTKIDWNDWRRWAFYFWFPGQFPVFVFGIILFFIYKSGKISALTGGLILAFSVGLFAVLAKVNFSLDFPQYFFQRQFVYGMVFLGIAIGVYATKNRFILSPLIQKMGVVSFSMYLNHFIVLSGLGHFGKPVILWVQQQVHLPGGLLSDRMERALKNDVIFLFAYVLTVACVYLLSTLTYRFVEKKGIDLGNRIIAGLKK